ncbi:protein-glutamate methylesterase/protein-glutamine glutaminase [Mucisphaera calidilacus]|uniref:Protein-glutamate methylesterase/protein-glutamine glutaminase n=1 Tax=Mucisphaera calidilacus TaxID=2527982 RepID=A0A518C0K6_9BACT|nr:chemotaxis response regulator protein-glutamate methylesterase [Mucisphaera calidilacus]QDU72744.1 Chemotaxis response regulator protein-glutamate methylesterase [Mucisphaera calidilacus]
MIKAVVVDDSAFMRRAISTMLNEDPRIEVVATGKNGLQAVELAKSLKPDVMTLDIEMPEMDGLTALRVIMRECPTRVLMCSSLTTEGSVESLRALRIGAVDVIAKDHSTFSTKMGDMRDDLLERIKAIAASRGRFTTTQTTPRNADAQNDTTTTNPPAAVRSAIEPVRNVSIVCIGSSTGGPPVLEYILERLPENFPLPIVVAQHMPKVFTESMANRLDNVCRMNVVHGGDGEVIRPGTITIMHGSSHHIITGRPNNPRIQTVEAPDEAYKPSVNLLLESATRVFGANALGIVLTGIGRDGANGAKTLKEAGGTILAQDEATSVVYGMPKAVVEDQTALAAMPPVQLAQALIETQTTRAAA